MASAICFTATLDGRVNIAFGHFYLAEPEVDTMGSKRFDRIVRRSLDARRIDLDRVLAHARTPGGTVGIVIRDDGTAAALLAAPGEGEGAPPQPEQWFWRTLRNEMMEATT